MKISELICEQKLDPEQSILEALIECERGNWTIVEDNGGTIVQHSDLVQSSLANKPPEVEKLLKKFEQQKVLNPLEAYGKRDKGFGSEGIIGSEFPKMRHAHLTLDISVFYTLEGQNPRLLKIYGVFRHKESGTDASPNYKIQKSLMKQFKNTTF